MSQDHFCKRNNKIMFTTLGLGLGVLGSALGVALVHRLFCKHYLKDQSSKKNCCSQTTSNNPTPDCKCDPCVCDPCECGTEENSDENSEETSTD